MTTVSISINQRPVVATITAVGAKGDPGEPGPSGDAAGLPAGGTTGQLLAKASPDDYDAAWVDAPEGGGGGEQGPPGEDGASAYDLAVANGYVGTEAAWLASLVGPAGPEGPEGPAGADGAPGEPGPAGDQGPAGAPGAAGLSAYEVALTEGFVGTETEWLATLVGAEGPEGPKGDTGDAGPAGAPGATTWAGITDKPAVTDLAVGALAEGEYLRRVGSALVGGTPSGGGGGGAGWGTPRTVFDWLSTGGGFAFGVASAGRAWFFRGHQGGAVGKIALEVTASSGNISVGLFANGGAGAAAAPAARTGTSGAVPCPAVGYAEIALGASVTFADGDWFAVSADNSTAQFRSAGGGGANLTDLAAGAMGSTTASHPLPSVAGTLTLYRSGIPLMRGIP